MANMHGHFKQEEKVTCPYNDSHSIFKHKLALHLKKCVKQHKNAGKKPCPFNSSHHIDVCEMVRHAAICPDRIVVDQFRYVVGGSGKSLDVREPVAENVVPCEENWDDDDHPTYNPNKRVEENGRLLVQLKGATPTEKRNFCEERKRKFNTHLATLGEYAGIDETVHYQYGYCEPGPEIMPDYTQECGMEPFDEKVATDPSDPTVVFRDFNKPSFTAPVKLEEAKFATAEYPATKFHAPKAEYRNFNNLSRSAYPSFVETKAEDTYDMHCQLPTHFKHEDYNEPNIPPPVLDYEYKPKWPSTRTVTSPQRKHFKTECGNHSAAISTSSAADAKPSVYSNLATGSGEHADTNAPSRWGLLGIGRGRDMPQ